MASQITSIWWEPSGSWKRPRSQRRFPLPHLWRPCGSLSLCCRRCARFPKACKSVQQPFSGCSPRHSCSWRPHLLPHYPSQPQPQPCSVAFKTRTIREQHVSKPATLKSFPAFIHRLDASARVGFIPNTNGIEVSEYVSQNVLPAAHGCRERRITRWFLRVCQTVKLPFTDSASRIGRCCNVAYSLNKAATRILIEKRQVASFTWRISKEHITCLQRKKPLRLVDVTLLIKEVVFPKVVQYMSFI